MGGNTVYGFYSCAIPKKPGSLDGLLQARKSQLLWPALDIRTRQKL